MKLVLSGYYGFDNCGDEAILLAIIQALKAEKEEVEICVLSNNPDETKRQYDVQAVNRWDWKVVTETVRNCDGLISGGGSLLQDETGWKTPAYYCGVMLLAKFFRKPFFIYSQGVGPLNGKFSRLLVSQTLGFARLITVRDEESKHLLVELGVDRNILVTPDPVMGLREEEINNKDYGGLEKWLLEVGVDGGGDEFVAVSVRPWKEEKRCLEELAKGLVELVKEGRNVVFVPMHGQEDFDCSREVLKLMTLPGGESGTEGKVAIAPFDLSVVEKIRLISKSRLVVGMRLHALIFAAFKKVPFLAISYDPKIDAFASLCGQRVIGNVTKEDWSGQLLAEGVRAYERSYDDQVEIVSEYVSKAKQDAQLPASMIIRHLVAENGD